MAAKKYHNNKILRESKNCWRIVTADRVSFLIDGASYFAAFRSAAERAKRSVLIVGRV
jgi:phosphatidylserine/phosphatidylglycerophosphate/cardiolipin synthase-like enzyme